MHPQSPVIHPSLVDRVARTAARRQRLPFQDADDLRSALWVKLLDHDGHVIRRFSGRGSLFGYLVRVASRLVLDQHAAEFGRWRPSRRATRIGADAVAWMKLVHRDGLSAGEASAQVTIASAADRSRIDAILSRCRPARRFVPIDASPAVQLADRAPLPPSALQRRESCQKIREALRAAIGELTPAERRLLRLRFHDGRRISEIATLDQRRAKELYREYSRLLVKLRGRLLTAGVDAGLVAHGLDQGRNAET
jgi:RNA polymerase sigma factor (sigma-70 family)